MASIPFSQNRQPPRARGRWQANSRRDRPRGWPQWPTSGYQTVAQAACIDALPRTAKRRAQRKFRHSSLLQAECVLHHLLETYWSARSPTYPINSKSYTLAHSTADVAVQCCNDRLSLAEHCAETGFDKCIHTVGRQNAIEEKFVDKTLGTSMCCGAPFEEMTEHTQVFALSAAAFRTAIDETRSS